MKPIHFVHLLCVIIICSIAPSSALAATGTVTANIKANISLTPFCTPTAANSYCAGARWLSASNGQAHPIRGVTVQLMDSASNTVIGQGVTSSSGAVSIFWNMSPAPAAVHMVWSSIRADGRFRVTDSNSNSPVWWDYSFVPVSGGVVSRGDRVWGNWSYTNVYYAAERVWDDAFRHSNLMLQKFTNVKIMVGAYSGSVTTGKTVKIANGNAGQFDVIAHELGHVGSDLASGNFKFCGAYMRDGNAGHSLRSPEWQCAGFEEGLATALGSRALYWQSAVEPKMYGEDLETPIAAPCSTFDSSRWELRTAAMWRDFYDVRTDGVDNQSTSYYVAFDVLDLFGSGTGNHGKNEPYKNWLLFNLDDKDGRSAEDFRYVAVNRAGINSTWMNAIYSQNCSPPGD